MRKVPLIACRRSGGIACHLRKQRVPQILALLGRHAARESARARGSSCFCSGESCSIFRDSCGSAPAARRQVLKRSLFCMKRSCSSGGMSRRFSTHFGGKPAMPRRFGWLSPRRRCSASAALLRLFRGVRRFLLRAPSWPAAPKLTPLRRGSAAPQAPSSKPAKPGANASPRRFNYAASIAIAGAGRCGCFSDWLARGGSQFGKRIEIGQHVVVLQHAQILDGVELFLSLAAAVDRSCRIRRGSFANPHAQRNKQRHRKCQPRLRHKPPKPSPARLGGHALAHARVEAKRRLDRRHLVQHAPKLAEFLGSRRGKPRNRRDVLPPCGARRNSPGGPDTRSIPFETSSHFMTAFLPPRDAALALAHQAAPVAPAGSHTPGTAAISARFPSTPESSRSPRNPSLHIYAAKRPRVAFPAAIQSPAG